MPPKKKTTSVVRESGGTRIKAAGKSLVWVVLDEAEKKKIRIAAATVGLPMSQFVKSHGLAAAEKILAK